MKVFLMRRSAVEPAWTFDLPYCLHGLRLGRAFTWCFCLADISYTPVIVYVHIAKTE